MTSQSLSGLTNLKHLCIKSTSETLVNFFVSIDRHLPMLQTIIYYCCGYNMNEVSFKYLSKLRRLKSIKFFIKSVNNSESRFTEEDIKDFIRNSPKIDSVNIYICYKPQLIKLNSKQIYDLKNGNDFTTIEAIEEEDLNENYV